jgi:transposase-like protein
MSNMDERALSHDNSEFVSITQAFLASELRSKIHCPRCGATIDFGGKVEWKGPDHFACGHCDRLVNKSLIIRAMNDLGIGQIPGMK